MSTYEVHGTSANSFLISSQVTYFRYFTPETYVAMAMHGLSLFYSTLLPEGPRATPAVIPEGNHWMPR
jgi:hypothetical protein